MAFWGLVLEPNKKYSSWVDKPFHIAMASLDLQNCDNSEDGSAVILRKQDSDFILCNLSKKRGIFNVPLNLQFELGGEINLHVSGNSTVHLTGGYIEELEEDDSDDSLEEEEDDISMDEKSASMSKLFSKPTPSPKKAEANGPKRKQDNASPQVNSKKTKIDAVVEEDDDNEEGFNFEEGMSSDEMGEEEEDDSDEDDDDDDDDEDEDEEEENGGAAELLKKIANSKKPKQGNQQQVKQNNQQVAKGKADEKKAQQGKQEKKEKAKPQSNTAANVTKSNGLAKKIVDGGVQIEDIKDGNGPVAKPGKLVSVYYVGRLKQNNKQFDATQSGQGFKFRLGKGEVIKGWDVGIVGMKVGSKRRLTIPAKMAYGSSGVSPQIPPNSTLVFDVELRNVK